MKYPNDDQTCVPFILLNPSFNPLFKYYYAKLIYGTNFRQ